MYDSIYTLYVFAALKKTNEEYAEKVRSGSAKENTLLDLAWKVDELSRLSSSGHSLRTEVVTMKELLENPTSDIAGTNAARKLTNLHKGLVDFAKGECLIQQAIGVFLYSGTCIV